MVWVIGNQRSGIVSPNVRAQRAAKPSAAAKGYTSFRPDGKKPLGTGELAQHAHRDERKQQFVAL